MGLLPRTTSGWWRQTCCASGATRRPTNGEPCPAAVDYILSVMLLHPPWQVAYRCRRAGFIAGCAPQPAPCSSCEHDPASPWCSHALLHAYLRLSNSSFKCPAHAKLSSERLL